MHHVKRRGYHIVRIQNFLMYVYLTERRQIYHHHDKDIKARTIYLNAERSQN